MPSWTLAQAGTTKTELQKIPTYKCSKRLLAALSCSMSAGGSPSTPEGLLHGPATKMKKAHWKVRPNPRIIVAGVIRPLVCRYPLVVVSQQASTFTYYLATTSVMIARPVTCLAMFSSFCPSTPMPRKLYAEVWGLKAPPRRTLAPAALTV